MIVKTIFLISVFGVHGSTITNVQVMPDMATCNTAKELVNDVSYEPETLRGEDFDKYVFKPRKIECVEKDIKK